MPVKWRNWLEEVEVVLICVLNQAAKVAILASVGAEASKEQVVMLLYPWPKDAAERRRRDLRGVHGPEARGGAGAVRAQDHVRALRPPVERGAERVPDRQDGHHGDSAT